MRTSSTPSIDLHAHALPRGVEELVIGQQGWASELGIQAKWQGPAATQRNVELWTSRYAHALADVDHRLQAMDRMGIDVQAVSLSPMHYCYWASPEIAARLVRVANEGIAALCEKYADRLVGLATVALQYPEEAAQQLGYAVRNLGLRGVQISTRVNDWELDDPRLEPFWRKAAELGVVVFIHPLGCTLGTRLARHYLSNVVGQPVETTVALSHLIFGGVLDRHPNLAICAAHGGGYLPYYIGRSDHAFFVRPDCRELRMPPSEYLRRIHYDSLVYDPDALRYLVEQAGPSQVVLGTDYPFDMGVTDLLQRLESVLGLTPREREQLRGLNAARLLKLSTYS